MRDYITVVSGLPRSGTSVMMQILAAGGLPALTDEIRQADIDNPKGYFEFEAVKTVKDDPSWVPGARGKVVKMVYRLLHDLPPSEQYRVVFMRRTLDEVIRSQEEMLRRNGKEGAPVEPARLVEIYRRQLENTDRWLAEQPNFRVLDVQYREVLDHTEETVHRLNDFLDGGLDTAAMIAVPDRSLYRNRAS